MWHSSALANILLILLTAALIFRWRLLHLFYKHSINPYKGRDLPALSCFVDGDSTIRQSLLRIYCIPS